MSVVIYSADFIAGSSTASLSEPTVGPFEISTKPPYAVSSHSLNDGLTLYVTRSSAPHPQPQVGYAVDGTVSIGVRAPWLGMTRGLISVEFDTVETSLYAAAQGGSDPRGTRLLKAGPWAVSAYVEPIAYNAVDQDKAHFGATCKFKPDSLALNVPGGAAANPLKTYSNFGPYTSAAGEIFALELQIDGIDSSNLIVGNARLVISHQARRKKPLVQQIPYHFQFLPNAPIGWVGADLVISGTSGPSGDLPGGFGTASVRLRKFSLSTLPPPMGAIVGSQLTKPLTRRKPNPGATRRRMSASN